MSSREHKINFGIKNHKIQASTMEDIIDKTLLCIGRKPAMKE